MFPIRDVHQIEMSSHCNLRCHYCPSRHLGRPKVHISEADYARALELAYGCIKAGTQREINLAGIGESTMHPEFVRFIHMARSTLGPHVDIVLATNGLLVTRDLAEAIAPARPRVFVSLHRPEKAGHAVQHLKAAGIFAGSSSDPSLAGTDWAGQVKWFNSHPVRRDCFWVRAGKVMVMADGRLTRCSLDADARGIIGHVQEDITTLFTTPYILCKTCDQDVGVPLPEEPYDSLQKAGVQPEARQDDEDDGDLPE